MCLEPLCTAGEAKTWASRCVRRSSLPTHGYDLALVICIADHDAQVEEFDPRTNLLSHDRLMEELRVTKKRTDASVRSFLRRCDRTDSLYSTKGLSQSWPPASFGAHI